MSDAFTFSSSSSDISEEDLRNSFSNLYNSSQGTQIIVNKIKERNYEDGTQTQIKIVDDIPNGDGAVTCVDPSTGNFIIEIEKDAFDGDYYRYNNGQDTNRMSLERYLAEELMHNYQRKTSGISIEDAKI